MDAKQLAAMVLEVRKEQRTYFALRKQNLPEAATQLEKCKRLEKKLDEECKNLLNPKSNQTSFF